MFLVLISHFYDHLNPTSNGLRTLFLCFCFSLIFIYLFIVIQWSREEHKRFLIGLKEKGRGNWNEIATKYVKTRTKSQVASHAQKYFLHVRGRLQNKNRSSVFNMPSEPVIPILLLFFFFFFLKFLLFLLFCIRIRYTNTHFYEYVYTFSLNFFCSKMPHLLSVFRKNHR